MNIAFIGFGEAAQAFAEGWHETSPATLRAYDIATDDPVRRAAKHADYARCGVAGADTLGAALAEADLILSLVTADASRDVAAAAAPLIRPGARFCDMNSVAPDTKRANARTIAAAGAIYADVAIMAPVLPARLAVPMLTSGEPAEDTAAALNALGFNVATVVGDIGAASAIKMIRSIMVKGIEALTAECLLSARAAGVDGAVFASLNATFPGFDWRVRADYNLDRMLVHGLRRAAEMDESAATATALGQSGAMARATADWQRRLGALAIGVPLGFAAKADAILGATGETAR